MNDRYGHLVGDEILISLCALLETVRRGDDSLIRWGGEEFLYLARGATRAEAPAIAERIRAAVEEYEFRIHDGPRIRLTCSIGFAVFPFLEDDPKRVSWEEVVDITDICLYSAKRAGRNRWVGLIARQSRSPETLVTRIRHSIDEVIASGEVEVITSSRHVPTTITLATKSGEG